jgi:hypothetical protein
MKVAVMQPYLFPYIGYWQMIHAVDRFVILDDVNYIKRGFINRNTILVNQEKKLITMGLKGASQNKLINEIEVEGDNSKILKTLSMSYKKAPFYNSVFEQLEMVLLNKQRNLALFVGDSLNIISGYLGIQVEYLYSSEISKDPNLKAQKKIIDIAKSVNAKQYINSIGGQDLYEKEEFDKVGIQLRFIETKLIPYVQGLSSFVPNLSIIDLMMHNDVDAVREMLDSYRLI